MVYICIYVCVFIPLIFILKYIMLLIYKKVLEILKFCHFLTNFNFSYVKLKATFMSFQLI